MGVSPERLTANPKRLHFDWLAEGSTATQEVRVSYSGNQEIAWNAQTNGAVWLQVEEGAGGTLNPYAADQTFKVTVNTAGLNSGTYTALLTINAAPGVETPKIRIRLSVGPPPGHIGQLIFSS
jgi:hypothetical protein